MNYKNIILVLLSIIILIIILYKLFINREKFSLVLKDGVNQIATFNINEIGILPLNNDFRIKANLPTKVNKFFKFNGKENISFESLGAEKYSVFFIFSVTKEAFDSSNNPKEQILLNLENKLTIKIINKKIIISNDKEESKFNINYNTLNYIGLTTNDTKKKINLYFNNNKSITFDVFKLNKLVLGDSLIGYIGLLHIFKSENTEAKMRELTFCDKLNELTCNFIAQGTSKFECKSLCMNDLNCVKDENDSDGVELCNELCESCETTKCQWMIGELNKQNRFVPRKIKIRGFSGNNLVKLSWLRPFSKYPIDKYYIIFLTKCNDYSIRGKDNCPQDKCNWNGVKCDEKKNKNVEIVTYEDDREIIDYYIKDLDNNISYTFFVFSKNQAGISNISNKITVMPNSKSDINIIDEDSYDDSLENLYKEKGVFNFQEKIKTSINLDELNYMQDKLINYIEEPLKSNYTINIL